MKSNLPRFWTPRTGGLLTLLGLAVVTIGATLLGESLIGRNSAPQQALPGPKLTIAPMFQGLQPGALAHVPTYSVRHTKKAERHPNPAVMAAATAAPVVDATPAAPQPVVALVERPVAAAPVAAQVPAAVPIRRHRHRHVAPAAVAQVRANTDLPLPTARPLPPRELVPVTTMTAPPPASSQLVPVPTVTAAPPGPVTSSAVLPTPVQTVTAPTPRT
jgi:hypothetical protein